MSQYRLQHRVRVATLMFVLGQEVLTDSMRNHARCSAPVAAQEIHPRGLSGDDAADLLEEPGLDLLLLPVRACFGGEPKQRSAHRTIHTGCLSAAEPLVVTARCSEDRPTRE